MTPNGKRHYQIDYDRGAVIRDLADGRTIHRYVDENIWRDAYGNPVPEQPIH